MQLIRAASSVLAVVPLTPDDRAAPGGCAALRDLAGHTLLQRAVAMLAGSGSVDRVVVPAPPALVAVLSADLGGGIEVVPVVEDGPWSWLRGVLRQQPGEPMVVVVHDPLQPLASAGLVDDVVDALRIAPGAAGAVPLGSVTDTLKWVDEDDVVTGTADRSTFRTVHSPQAYLAGPLLAALTVAPPAALSTGGPAALPGLVLAAGGRLRTVPAPAEVLRVGSPDDLLLVEALLGTG